MTLLLLHKLLLFLTATLVVSASSHPFHPSDAVSSINKFYKNNRFKGAFLTCAIKGCSADGIAQYLAYKKERDNDEDKNSKQSTKDGNKRQLRLGGGKAEINTVEEDKKKFSIDLRRSAVFLLYGGFYQGCCQEIIYNDLLPRCFGTGTDFKTVASKVFVDMGLITPLVCIPVAYIVKGMLVGSSFVEILQNYWSDVVNQGVLFKNWMIFVPVQCLTFSVIPPHFRVSFVAFVSFFWMIILSCILSG